MDNDNPFGEEPSQNISLEPADMDPLEEKMANTGMDDVPIFSTGEADASYNELAPPSYDDSVAFESSEQPAEEATEEKDEPSTTVDEPTTKSTKASELEITVSDPMKQPEKDSLIGSTYVSYKIESVTTLPEYKRKDLVVRRRFREFVALAERLNKSHRGYFIPPRPDKNVVEGKLHSTEFVEVRRVALQKYLQKLSNHPVLSRSRELQIFLEWEGDISSCGEWKEMDNAGWKEGLTNLPKQLMGNESSIPSSEEASSKRDGSNLIRGFKEFKQKFSKQTTHDVASDLDSNEDLKEEKMRIKDLQVYLAEASAEAEHMIKRMEKVADGFGDFGLSAIKTSKFEEEEGCRNGKYSESGEHIREISQSMKSTGTQCVRMSRLVRSATENTAAQLSSIHDYLGLMPAALAGLRERDQAQLTYATLGNELKSKQQQIQKLEAKESKKFGGDKGKTRKVHELTQDVEALAKAKKAASKEFLKIQDRNIEELERFAKEKEVDFSAMLLGFAKVQAALYERTVKVWRDVESAAQEAAETQEEEETAGVTNPLTYG
jgi:sorting nexin-1/2